MNDVLKALDQAAKDAVESSPDLRQKQKRLERIFNIAQSVRIARRSKGLTQKQLAEKIGRTQPFIARLENPTSDREPSMKTLSLIAQATESEFLAELPRPVSLVRKGLLEDELTLQREELRDLVLETQMINRELVTETYELIDELHRLEHRIESMRRKRHRSSIQQRLYRHKYHARRTVSRTLDGYLLGRNGYSGLRRSREVEVRSGKRHAVSVSSSGSTTYAGQAHARPVRGR